MTTRRFIGVDVGGSKIKGALVDIAEGELSEPNVVETPASPTPREIADVVAKIVAGLSTEAPAGIALPCVVDERGIARTAENIAGDWIDFDARELFTHALGGRRVALLNDADAAGLAEARFGAARGLRGTVLVLTFGTGIGSALLHKGALVPNVEFGQLAVDGVPAEHLVSSKVRTREGVPWPVWARRVNRFLEVVESVTRPECIVIGGGVSTPEHVREWADLIGVESRADVVAAGLANNAGMIGAALHAADAFS